MRNRYFLLADAFLFTASTVAAFALRFEGFAWGPEYSRAALLYALISIPLKLVIAYRTGLYERLWRHAGVLELERLILASSLMAFLCFLLGAWLLPASGFTTGRLPLSVLLLDALLTAVQEIAEATGTDIPCTQALLGLARLDARVRGLYPAS